jgi:glycosyltransferase involved in cell wall biosynthesis
MRILFLGNTNNEPYRLAHELTHFGHQCLVVVSSRSKLDSTEQLSAIPYYESSTVRVVNSLRYFPALDWMLPSKALIWRLRSLAEAADVVVTNGFCHALMPNFRGSRVAFITGSDLVALTDPQIVSDPPGRLTRIEAQLRRLDLVRFSSDFVRRQADGIASAKFLVTIPPGASASTDAALIRVNAQALPRYQFLCAVSRASLGISSSNATGPYAPLPSVLNASRVDFTGRKHQLASDYDSKGTDILLQGWSLARRQGLEANLLLIRKGRDIDEADSLIRQLNIGDSVRWIRPMAVSDLISCIDRACTVTDSLGGATPGRVSLEALINRTPVIGRASPDELRTRFGGDLPGFVSAGDPCSVAKHLHETTSQGWDGLVTQEQEERLFDLIAPLRTTALINEAIRAAD